MLRRGSWGSTALFGLLASVACSHDPTVSQVAEIYDHHPLDDRAIERHDPIVVVPGFLGSVLRDRGTGELVWGRFLGRSNRPRDADYVRSLALPVADAPLAGLQDKVEVVGAMRVAEVDLGRRTTTINAYPGVLTGILVGWDEDDRPTRSQLTHNAKKADEDQIPLLDQVGYDWRRDIAESAATLHEHLVEARSIALAHRRSAGLPTEDVRLDVVGHSTGCLVLRYYLRYGTQPLPEDGSLPDLNWAGAKLVRRAILVAPPNRGSLSAFESLAHGGRPFPILPHFPAPLLGSFVSLYQLMPPPAQGMVVYEDGVAVDLYDVSVWERHGWSLFDPEERETLSSLLPDAVDDTERDSVARAYMARALQRARQLHEALAVPQAPPHGTTIHLFAADGLSTQRQLVVSRDDGQVVDRREGPGDGTVTRGSALADLEPFDSDLRPLVGPVEWSSVHWVEGDHIGMIGEAVFIDNLLFMLFEDPRWSAPTTPAALPPPTAPPPDPG